jgi:hypothetical protein
MGDVENRIPVTSRKPDGTAVVREGVDFHRVFSWWGKPDFVPPSYNLYHHI